jgi:hypothetical protein
MAGVHCGRPVWVRGTKWGQPAIGRVKPFFGSYLEQHFASVMRVFLDNSILTPANPHVPLIVDKATMELLGK